MWCAVTDHTNQLLIDRFWRRVDKSGGCWLWKGSVQRNYGAVTIPLTRRTVKAHRLAWEIVNGRPVPPRAYVLHSCDTPLCVNPAHLRLGTPADNVRDMHARGRSWQGKTMRCPKGHPYDAVNTHVSGGRRFCRECNRLATIRRRQRARD